MRLNMSIKPSTHIHMVGIGGTGLSAIALYLIESGYKVTGSDRQYSSLAQRVETAGGKIYVGHNRDQILGADLVIRSSAISDENVEIVEAQSVGIPVYKRSEFLGKMMEGYQAIAVAGTHGKTTTTAMITWMLIAAGLDPSYIIGGVSKNLGSNAHAGDDSIFVIEADEYDHMFLGLLPQIAVITTIEYDHPDCFPTPDDFYQAFIDFASRLSPDGVLIVCTDERNTLRFIEEVKNQGKETITYGLKPNLYESKPDFWGTNLEVQGNGTFAFEVIHEESNLARIFLQVPGRHNVQNALATFAVGHRLGISAETIVSAISDFTGVDRRFEVRGEIDGVIVVDDYAHHPTEICATLSAARDRYPEHELWAVWQPHTYSRTIVYFNDFINSFQDADHVIVTKTYAAREAIHSTEIEDDLVREMSHPDVRFISDLNQVSVFLSKHLHKDSVVMILSAGDAYQLGSRLLEDLSTNSKALDE